MTTNGGFSRDTHRYLDEEPHGPLDAGERAEADGLVDATEAYGRLLPTPGAEVDRAVMTAVRAEPHTRSRRWRWWFEPRTVRIRPVWLAAAATLLLVLVWNRAPSGVSPGAPGSAGADTVFVRFEVRAPGARDVRLAGSFNEWASDGITLTPSSGDTWAVTVPLPVGKHEYLFFVDGQWVADSAAYAQVDDGFGGVNSVIVVGPRGVVRT